MKVALLVTALNGGSVASVREGRGTIVNVASMYGLIGSAPHIPATAYVAAKHGVYYSPSKTVKADDAQGVMGITKAVRQGRCAQ
jgi:NAD(P)-dependent dehydrogenase (short-subunit alcohol dehydrogenase family)